ncbi:MAG TPA: thioredoxin domain-containing protein [Solirubrobacterales bacterium]
MSGKTAREERREQRLREEGEAEGQDRRQRLLKLGSAVAFLAIVAVVVAVVISQSQSGGGGGGTAADASLVRSELTGIPQSGMVLGQPSAKVTLFEFGDLQCPVCKSYSEEVIPPLIESEVRSGKAKIEFRNFTIISEESVPAGAAAIAAGRQGRGWNYLELFYRNQGTERSGYVTDAFMTKIARGAGVPDLARWNRERKSKAILDQVRATTSEAERLGFSGTPSFAVKGPASGGMKTLGTPESATAIEEAIAQAG